MHETIWKVGLVKYIAFMALFISAVHSAVSVGAASVKSELKMERAGVRHFISLRDLEKKLQLTTLTVEDPVYHSKKTYEGYLLADVFRIAGMDQTSGDEIAFHCVDGYSPAMQFARLADNKGLLAIREKGRKGGWERFQQGKVWMTPAPFYVVWENAQPEKPWPYQVIGIEVINFKQKYDRLYPTELEKTSAGYKGFQTFKNECLRCHSLNLQGGDLGPELNISKNITEYRDDAFLTHFIKNPGEFRERSKMPAFPQLSDGQISEVIEYFRYMKSHKQLVK
ncbi:MAG: c-type cytochrome [Methylotenera sp.]|nr:c-type cytochrome [Oligoflexia bacterium]